MDFRISNKSPFAETNERQRNNMAFNLLAPQILQDYFDS